MVMDMFLTLGQFEPIKVLAWSTSKRGEDEQKSKSDNSSPTADTWDVKAVGDWLRKNNFEDFVGIFEDHEISGKELLLLNGDDLKDMGCKYTIGQKIRFLNASKQLVEQMLEKEKRKQKKPKPMGRGRGRYRGNADLSLSMTLYWDSRASHCFASFNKAIPEARLVVYKGLDRYNSNKKDADLANLVDCNTYDPFITIVAKNCQIMSFSLGGSGGQDRFTANVSLISSNYTYMYQQYPGSEARLYQQFFNRPHGAIVNYEVIENRTNVKEWGKQLDWTLETHFSFPQEFKMAVKTILLVHKSKQNKLFSTIPSEIIKYVFYLLSVDYIPTNPMEGVEFPGRIKVDKKSHEPDLRTYSDSD